ncbi:MAG: hypothetical protein F6K58_22990 [Symploca sp. SIO2E9]|nr:hypothetical protein [Symploca sp. SIO2E9]
MKSSIFKKLAVAIASTALSLTVIETNPVAAESFSFIQGSYAEQTTLLNSFVEIDSKLIPPLKEEVFHLLAALEANNISSLGNEGSTSNTEIEVFSNSRNDSESIPDLIIKLKGVLEKRVHAFLGDRVHRRDLRVYLVLGLAIIWISSWRANFQGHSSPPKQE